MARNSLAWELVAEQTHSAQAQVCTVVSSLNHWLSINTYNSDRVLVEYWQRLGNGYVKTKFCHQLNVCNRISPSLTSCSAAQSQMRGQSFKRLSSVLTGVGAGSFRFTRAGTSSLSAAAGAGSISGAGSSGFAALSPGGSRVMGGATVRSAHTALAAAAAGHQRTLLELLASGSDRDAVADALRALPTDGNDTTGANGSGANGAYADGDDSDSEEQRVATRKAAHARAVAAAADAAKARAEAAAKRAAASSSGGEAGSGAGGSGADGSGGSRVSGGKALSIEEAAVEAMRATLERAALEVRISQYLCLFLSERYANVCRIPMYRLLPLRPCKQCRTNADFVSMPFACFVPF
jgi:hypothetical protein